MENRQRTIRKLLWRITAVLAVLAVVSICFVSGTFARYVSNRNGSTETDVAKWDIDFTDGENTDGENAVENNFTVTVGKLSPDMSEYGTLDDDDKQSAGDGYPGQRVKTTDAVLALQITNSGDVDATLTITPPEKNSLIFYGYAENGTDAAETAYEGWSTSTGTGFAMANGLVTQEPTLKEAQEVITMQFALTKSVTAADIGDGEWKSISDFSSTATTPVTVRLPAKAEGAQQGTTYYFYARAVWTSRDEYYYQQNQQTAEDMSDGLDTWLGEHIAAVGAAFTFSVVQASELPGTNP